MQTAFPKTGPDMDGASMVDGRSTKGGGARRYIRGVIIGEEGIVE